MPRARCRAQSGYYQCLTYPQSARAAEDARLLRLIRASFKASHGIYGAPRVFLLIRAFRRELGLPPHAYVIQQRVQLTKRRIAAGESLTLVALAIGFADQSHLSRHFRRIVGVPPGLYARAEVRIVQDGGDAGR